MYMSRPCDNYCHLLDTGPPTGSSGPLTVEIMYIWSPYDNYCHLLDCGPLRGKNHVYFVTIWPLTPSVRHCESLKSGRTCRSRQYVNAICQTLSVSNV